MTEIINAPELRFPEFKDEWIEKAFGDFTKTNQGLQIAISNRETQYKEGYYFYITNEFLKPNNKIKYYIKNPPNSVIANKDDILMTRTGNTGKVITGVHGAFHNNFFKIKFDNKQYDRLFIYELLKSSKINNKILSLAGTSTIPDLNHSDFYSIKSFIPKYEEQQKLGIFFSKLDRQIELEEKKLELLEQQKRGYMQKLFSQELRFKGKNGNEYPEWQLKNLSELGETFTGLSGKTKDDFGYGDGLFITYMNVFKNTIAKSDMVERVKIEANENQNKVQYGDILFTTSSEVPNEVGMSSIWLFNQDNVYLNSFCFGFRVVVNYIKPVYLARYLRSEEMRKTITILAQGSTRFNISKKEMMKLNIKVPYIEEQVKIDNFFNKIDTLILKQGKKIELLKQRKQGLLQKMFV
ncbi:type I restriction enzyme S subunit [Staphylococcus hominis]|uniref:restriction endonuclease subunit S n=1 Tax=Staphylococcus hominis TaxID=1290 RepID=UPI00160F03C8|nr:restriction endonuclease subunit S [Staphylococcus hominis]MBB4833623.1 type I restriction enzyme S subunit [Staphylococcus hominis]